MENDYPGPGLSRPGNIRPRLLLHLLFFLSAAQDAYAQSGEKSESGFARQTVQLQAANLVLLEIRLNGYLLSDSINAYQSAQRIFLPLGEVTRALTIAIQVSPGARSASGFIRHEDSRFALNLNTGVLDMGGRQTPLDPQSILMQDDDIYVDSRTLARWLKVDFDVNFNALQLNVKPIEPLPVQQRLEREQMAGRLPGQRPLAAAGPALPQLKQAYSLIDVPFIDQTLSMGLRRGNGINTNAAAYTTYMKGDVLGMQGAAFISGTNSDPTQTRFTLGRSDPGAQLLGPLSARNFAVGNVPVAGVLNLTRTNDTGRGISFNNLPLDRPTRFNTHTLQGDLPPGWDVELYYNDGLVAYQQSRADGRYLFEDLPLAFGPNEFRLVFHGPQGQLRVERQTFMLDESITTPGSLLYNVASSRDQDGLRHSAVTGEYGLNRTLTLAGSSLANERVDGSTNRYNSVGLRAFTGPALLTGSFTRQGEGGTLTDLGLKTLLGKTAVSYNRLFASRDFNSDYFIASSDPVRVRDRLRLDGSLPGGSAGRLPYNLQVQRDQTASGASISDSAGLISANFGAVSISNLLHLGIAPGNRNFDGTFSTGSALGAVRLRGQISYNLKPDTRFTALALNADRTLNAGYLLSLGATRSFTSPELILTAALNKSLGDYGLSLTGGYSSHGQYTVGVVLFMGIGRDPRTGAWKTGASPAADTGAASALVYLDRNGNGKFDQGDERLRNVGFMVNGSNTMARTNADGLAYIDRLPPWRATDLTLNRSTLEDPQMSPRQPGYRLLPRPGKVASMDFPVVFASELDGTVQLQRAGKLRGLSNVQVELVDREGKVVAGRRTENTGYYHFDEVPPGDYSIRISPEQLEKLHLRASAPHALRVLPSGDPIPPMDFRVFSDEDAK